MNKYIINGLIGGLSILIDFLFGGFSMVLQVLLILMIFDYLTGLLTALSSKSRKTASGKLSSKAGFRGLCKKVVILIICAVAFQLDKILNANNMLFIGVSCFYCSNEVLSIIENAIVLNIPVPNKLKNAIEDLRKEGD